MTLVEKMKKGMSRCLAVLFLFLTLRAAKKTWLCPLAGALPAPALWVGMLRNPFSALRDHVAFIGHAVDNETENEDSPPDLYVEVRGRWGAGSR
jgi:hypothetical protein